MIIINNTVILHVLMFVAICMLKQPMFFVCFDEPSILHLLMSIVYVLTCQPPFSNGVNNADYNHFTLLWNKA